MHGPRGKNPEATFNLRIEREKLNRLREIAHRAERSVVAHLRVMVDREIAEHENEEQAA